MLPENMIKRKSYFVKAAIDMIQKSGLESLSARTVAKAAGFNGASIYTYFQNMDHLVALACVYYIQDYIRDLGERLPKAESWLERDLLIQEMFFKYALKAPDIYCKVYYPTVNEPWVHTLHKEFYEMFPEYYFPEDNFLHEFITLDHKEDNYQRNMFMLLRAEKEGSIRSGSAPYIYAIHEAIPYHILHRKNVMEQFDLNSVYRYVLKCMLGGIYYYVTAPYQKLLNQKMEEYDTIAIMPPSGEEKQPSPERAPG